jgi:hypothetical protein
VIFSRRRGSGQGDEPDQQRSEATRDVVGAGPAERPSGGKVPPKRQRQGPYDVAAAPKGRELLDLGALRIPVVEGVEVRVQADPEGRVQQVALVAGDNALQLGVFAAPRTEPIWDEVREELRAQLRGDGPPRTEATVRAAGEGAAPEGP